MKQILIRLGILITLILLAPDIKEQLGLVYVHVPMNVRIEKMGSGLGVKMINTFEAKPQSALVQFKGAKKEVAFRNHYGVIGVKDLVNHSEKEISLLPDAPNLEQPMYWVYNRFLLYASSQLGRKHDRICAVDTDNFSNQCFSDYRMGKVVPFRDGSNVMILTKMGYHKRRKKTGYHYEFIHWFTSDGKIKSLVKIKDAKGRIINSAWGEDNSIFYFQAENCDNRLGKDCRAHDVKGGITNWAIHFE